MTWKREVPVRSATGSREPEGPRTDTCPYVNIGQSPCRKGLHTDVSLSPASILFLHTDVTFLNADIGLRKY